jgi:cell division septum initiation protein DivIVA
MHQLLFLGMVRESKEQVLKEISTTQNKVANFDKNIRELREVSSTTGNKVVQLQKSLDTIQEMVSLSKVILF